MRIEHVAVWTPNLERLRAFYATWFGATAGPKYVNPGKGFESYFLSFAGGPRLELMTRAGAATPPPALFYATGLFNATGLFRRAATGKERHSAGRSCVQA